MKNNLIIIISTVVALHSHGQKVTADWSKGSSIFNKAINCGRADQPGGANNTQGSRVTFGVEKSYDSEINVMRWPGEQSVEFWTNAQYEETCNQNFTAERAEMSSGGAYRNLGVKEGATVWVGWSELWREIDETHSATIMQFRSNCGKGSPATEVYMRPGGIMEVHAANGAREKFLRPKLNTWYDFIAEIKYSKGNDGYINIYYKESTTGEYNLVSVNNAPTMHKEDDCPHIRWGVYRWQSGDKKPEQIPERDWMMVKYVGTVRIAVGKGKFEEVRPRPLEEKEVPVQAGVEVDGLVNLARKGIASQSSTYGTGHAGVAIDGIIHGDYPHGDNPTISHTNQDNPAFLHIELPALAWVDHITIHNRKDQFRKRLAGAKIIVGGDSIATLTQDDIQEYPVNTFAKGVTILNEDFLHVSEVEIWGRDTTIVNNTGCTLIDTVITYYEQVAVDDSVYYVVDTINAEFRLTFQNGAQSLPFKIASPSKVIERMPIMMERKISLKVCREEIK